MKRCPLSYEPIRDGLYSDKGLRKLSPGLHHLDLLNFTRNELLDEAKSRAVRISIQGVQPKLSAVLNLKHGRFDLVDTNGRFILKPQHPEYDELPENEDLSMRLARIAGIDVPYHGLIYAKDGSLNYIIKRFDRKGQKDKIAVEDFAQLAGLSRDTKYNYSMEKLLNLIDEYCTFPLVEKARLFRLVIFNYLIGNEDMHLKNYSVIIRDQKVELSPAYDLLNSTIVLKGDAEEIALTVKGKKKNLNYDVLVNYFGIDRCKLTHIVIEKTLDSIRSALPGWSEMIDQSFLSDTMKEKYHKLVATRAGIMGFTSN